MIKRLLHRSINKFERQYNYDAGYMHGITDSSPGATIRLMLLAGMNAYTGPELTVWGGAALAATLHGDCGPCAQLMIDKLLEVGLDKQQIAACLQHDWQQSEAMGLGYRFAAAVLNDSAEVDSLRTEIRHTSGEQALIAASFAATSYIIYPLVKRALGNAQMCTSVSVGELTINPKK